MSVFDGKRLPAGVFKLDVERMRQGWYSDKYFINIARTLAELARQGYRFGGRAPDLSDLDVDLAAIDVGSIEVEIQWFPRRQPSCIVVGVDKASKLDKGRIASAPELDRRIDMFLRYYDGFGAIIVQMNVEDTRNGVAEYIIQKVDIFKECGADGWVRKYEEEMAKLA